MIAKLQETDSSGGVHIWNFHHHIFCSVFCLTFYFELCHLPTLAPFLRISYIWHKHARSCTQSKGHWWYTNFAHIILLSKLSSLLLPSSESIYHFQKQYNIYTKWFPWRKGLFNCHIELLKWLLTSSQQDIELVKSNIAQLSCVSPWRGGTTCVLQSPPELCGRSLWPLAGSTSSIDLRDRIQTKDTPWSSMLGVVQ